MAAQQRARGEVTQRELRHCGRVGECLKWGREYPVRAALLPRCCQGVLVQPTPCQGCMQEQGARGPESSPCLGPPPAHQPSPLPPVQLARSIISSTIWLASRTCRGAECDSRQPGILGGGLRQSGAALLSGVAGPLRWPLHAPRLACTPPGMRHHAGSPCGRGGNPLQRRTARDDR